MKHEIKILLWAAVGCALLLGAWLTCLHIRHDTWLNINSGDVERRWYVFGCQLTAVREQTAVSLEASPAAPSAASLWKCVYSVPLLRQYHAQTAYHGALSDAQALGRVWAIAEVYYAPDLVAALRRKTARDMLLAWRAGQASAQGGGDHLGGEYVSAWEAVIGDPNADELRELLAVENPFDLTARLKSLHAKARRAR